VALGGGKVGAVKGEVAPELMGGGEFQAARGAAQLLKAADGEGEMGNGVVGAVAGISAVGGQILDIGECFLARFLFRDAGGRGAGGGHLGVKQVPLARPGCPAGSGKMLTTRVSFLQAVKQQGEQKYGRKPPHENLFDRVRPSPHREKCLGRRASPGGPPPLQVVRRGTAWATAHENPAGGAGPRGRVDAEEGGRYFFSSLRSKIIGCGPSFTV